MVWAIGLDDFKNRCGDGPYPLLSVITEVLTGGSDCNPTTTSQSPQTSAEPQPTTEEPNPQPTTANTTPAPQTTAAPTTIPTTTDGGSGSGSCRPTDIYCSTPGMVAWCESNCNHNPPFCPASHCICDGSTCAAPTKKICKGLSSVYDQWCDANCNHNPPYCPASHCRCD